MILPINIAVGENGLNGIDKHLRIKWFQRLPSKKMWINPNGEFYKGKITTAAILFEWNDRERVTKKKKITGGDGWIFVNKSEKKRKSDVAIFRYSPRVELVKELPSNFNLDAYHVVRLTKIKPTKKFMDQLYDAVRKWNRNHETTTGMINMTKKQLALNMRKVLKSY